MQCLVPRLACCFNSLVHRLACCDLRCIETLWLFPLGSQLPYLMDGDHKISQSNAILRYIARKHSMCKWWSARAGIPMHFRRRRCSVKPACVSVAAGGETEEEMIRVDMMENLAMDFRNGFVMLCYGPDYVSTPGEQGFLKPPCNQESHSVLLLL